MVSSTTDAAGTDAAGYGLAALPSATRILLTGDGATTVMLEALLDVPLRVRVVDQRVVDTAAVPPAIRRALAAERMPRLLERLSELVDPVGRPVSRNRVVSAVAATGQLPPPTDPTPLGMRLREERRALHRELLRCGVAHTPEAPHFGRCAFKEYVIRSPDRYPVYVAERFNPAVVGVA
ncbi:hypothetical protein [Streptomyces sp. NPDC052496]|uniref:hypothetical protein n=1 Tax=Streptomyces sp. NPDC052496 TaxID=3154951 RepID=UPI0034386782